MKSILQQLYDGEIAPSEQFKPYLEEYNEKWNKICKAESAFIEKLTEQQEKEFDNLMEEHVLLMPLELAQVFTDGFKLGAQIMCEVFYKEGQSGPDLLQRNEGPADGR